MSNARRIDILFVNDSPVMYSVYTQNTTHICKSMWYDMICAPEKTHLLNSFLYCFFSYSLPHVLALFVSNVEGPYVCGCFCTSAKRLFMRGYEMTPFISGYALVTNFVIYVNAFACMCGILLNGLIIPFQISHCGEELCAK